MSSSKPFSEAAAGLLEQRGMSGRRLAAETGLSQTAIALMLRGELAPSLQAMEAVAKALDVEPTWFAEYRLDARREQLNWRTRGLKRALTALGE